MASVSIYLNFSGKTEEAFAFYKEVFGTEYEGGMMRFKDVPSESAKVSEVEQNLVMHVTLPILAGFKLMGTDAPESLGMKVVSGNNTYINLEPDTREEADRLFNALSSGGTIEMPLEDMFWGDYFGSFVDRFGICWMINCAAKK
jgi:PhnB protein